MEADAANAAIAAGRQFNAPLLIFGLTGNTGEANLRLYAAAGVNGCIAKGLSLAPALRQANRDSNGD